MKKPLLIILVLIVCVLFGYSVVTWLDVRITGLATPLLRGAKSTALYVTDTTGKVLTSKAELYAHVRELEQQLQELSLAASERNVLRSENQELKAALNRTPDRSFTLAAVLSRPNKTIYDTFRIDAGSREGIAIGDRVFAFATTPIGTIVEVSHRSALVQLFSTPGYTAEALLQTADDTTMPISVEGIGGGAFTFTVPREVIVEAGMPIVIPGITPDVFGIVGDVIFDERDPVKQVFFSSPVNVQTLRFVYVTTVSN